MKLATLQSSRLRSLTFGRGAVIIAGKSEDTNGVRVLVQDRDAWPNIPPSSSQKATLSFSRCATRQRNLVEHVFNCITDARHRRLMRPKSQKLLRRHQARSHPHLDQTVMSPFPQKYRLARKPLWEPTTHLQTLLIILLQYNGVE
ncbi:hypothetical protein ACFQ4O_05520 [Methylopila musalis]|uniref:Transposase n=1 Tax=Methylopila musalis TaxID=1134781 RepID=A0ABW3Z5B8_9HYPH